MSDLAVVAGLMLLGWVIRPFNDNVGGPEIRWYMQVCRFDKVSISLNVIQLSVGDSQHSGHRLCDDDDGDDDVIVYCGIHERSECIPQ